MFDTKQIAEELLLGELDVTDLHTDIEFLKEVDKSLVSMVDNPNFSDAQIARKRQQVMDRIAVVLNEEEGHVSNLQRSNRFKRKR